MKRRLEAKHQSVSRARFRKVCEAGDGSGLAAEPPWPDLDLGQPAARARFIPRPLSPGQLTFHLWNGAPAESLHILHGVIEQLIVL